MDDVKMISARAVLQECFWGDYLLSAEDLLERLEQDEPGFDRFIFSKIMENSSYPSRHIRTLFPPEKWRQLLDGYRKTGRETKRFRLVEANMTGNYSLAREYAWRV